MQATPCATWASDSSTGRRKVQDKRCAPGGGTTLSLRMRVRLLERAIGSGGSGGQEVSPLRQVILLAAVMLAAPSAGAVPSVDAVTASALSLVGDATAHGDA